MSSKMWSLILALFAALFAVQTLAVKIDDDVGLTVMQLIKKRGYEVEEHKVTTKDRYVLTMYRIPKSYDETQSNTPAAANKPAVYVIHGLFDSSFTYVNNFRTQSLAFMLADAGYDVWLGNNRGTVWSNEHLDLSTSDPQYWDFSWEQMADYDTPAMLEYVLAQTKRPMISYIGHSEGTMIGFAHFSSNQKLAKKISYYGALGPVAHLGNMQALPLKALANLNAEKVLQAFGNGPFAPKSSVLQEVIGSRICAATGGCDNVINMIMGPSKNVNQSRFDVYIGQTPSGTSVKNIAHFAQGIREGTFARFNYGCKCTMDMPITLCASAICKNKDVYGTFNPPAWQLAVMYYPRTALFTGTDDWMAVPKDVQNLRQAVPAKTIISQKTVAFNHMDFTWAINANTLIYADLIKEMMSYEGKGY
ncbi:hypothetical protein Poli38472_005553 [Pythium oligandrum]|uniref:Lipase n=1 Tax=Pythium oligandrum TaxID=41045 RepID=A0A8K1CGR2_PYTOL|nr:hypothetical protein Poli38472_005553 [Pythium oligandrum]|eukprot:TMW62935.1 hypothetical protein Poli38472_005553 [Pythium oligandrum]